MKGKSMPTKGKMPMQMMTAKAMTSKIKSMDKKMVKKHG